VGFPLSSLTQNQNVFIVIAFFIEIAIAIDIAIEIDIDIDIDISFDLVFALEASKIKKPRFVRNGVFKERRRHTLPQIAVPSAQAGLTSLFGMGRGEPRRNNHLKVVCFKLTPVSF
jgi:hypothetical protein